MSSISMSYEDLQTYASNYDSESEEVNALIGRLDTLMNDLMASWEGQAAQAFDGQYQELKPSIQNLETLLADIGTQLRNVSTMTQEFEQGMSSSFGIK